MKKIYLHVSPDGRLALPPELASSLGLLPGSKLAVEVRQEGLYIPPPVSHLARVYIEPTNTCNLSCRTCMRSVWEEPLGCMDASTFRRVLQGVGAFYPPPVIFFGGFGEPLFHSNIMEMVQEAKALGSRVEMISNGILLTNAVSEALIQAGLDMLWVSIDGACPESYADVRLGAELPQIMDNLRGLRRLKMQSHRAQPELGFAFVAMRRNIRDLPEVLRLGARLGVSQFSISNVLSHTSELAAEELYDRSLYDGAYQVSSGLPHISFPRMDVLASSLAAAEEVLSGRYKVSFAGAELGSSVNRCPFTRKNSLSIRWDGAVSPCLPLLHTHQSYLDKRLRVSKAYSIGSVLDKELAHIWSDPGYVALRERLEDFDFSPCTFCNSCELADSNQEDCFGSPAPACGGCLWAQGIIQCP